MVSNDRKYFIFLGLAMLLVAMGLVLTPSLPAIWEGWGKLIRHPSLLDMDALRVAGNFGTAFVNSGTLLLLVLLLYRVTKTQLQGLQIAAAMMIVGFAFYGKNILNVWFTVAGVLLYAKVNKKALSAFTAMAWFSTALSPVFSVLAFGTGALGPGSPLAITIGAAVGVLSGYLVAVLAGNLPSLHKGYLIYNAGFAAGIAGMLVNAGLKALAVGHDKYPYVEAAEAAVSGAAADYVTGQNGLLGLTLLIPLAYLIAAGLLLGGGKGYKKMMFHRCKGGDFTEDFGLGSTLINMGVMGILAVAYVFLTFGGQFAGPIFGCVWTIVGFAAAGVTVRMYLPLLCGVYATAFLTGGISGAVAGNPFLQGALAKVGSRGMLLAAVFSGGLCPVVCDFGWRAGLLMGGLHCVLVPNLTVLHGWMSLYNNALSEGLLATFLYPFFSRLAGKVKNQETGEKVKNE